MTLLWKRHPWIPALSLAILLAGGSAFLPGPGGAARAADEQKTGSSAASTGGAKAAAAWEEAAGLQAVVGDTLDAAARIFESPDYQHHLLVPGKGEHAFLLNLKLKTVDLLPRSSLTWNESEQPRVDVKAAAPAGTFESAEGVVSFVAAGDDWKIQPEPPLIGMVTTEKLRQAKPDYAYAASRYTPDADAVKALKGVTADTKIAVFFGTWCTYCKHYLPHFLRTVELAANPKIAVEFYGVSEDQAEPKDAIQKYHVTQTPSFIVLQGGKELGRIEEEPDVTMESDLAAILKAR